MGVNLFHKNSSCQVSHSRRTSSCNLEQRTDSPTGNPNPRNFEILRLAATARHLVAMIRYPDCSNYEGRKILVFEGVKEETFISMGEVDPHFCDDKHVSPIARFRPTEEGWREAHLFVSTKEGYGSMD